MSKKNKKYDILLFPILFLLTPFLVFLAISTYKYIGTGIFNYKSNFIYFYDVILNIKEYLFPMLLALTSGLLILVLTRVFSKKMRVFAWIFLCLIGTFIIACGSRILFAFNQVAEFDELFRFILHGITPYTVLFALEATYLICIIIKIFEVYLFKK